MTSSELATYRLALDSHAIVAITDTKGTITFANDKFCQISGYSKEELIGQNHRILKSGHHPEAFFADMYRIIANGEMWHGRIKNRAKDGSYYWVDTTIAPVSDINGKIVQYVAIRTDVTDLYIREKALIDQNERFDAALDNMSQGLCMFDSEQRLIVCNGLYATMYGLSSDLVIPGTTFRQILEHRIKNNVFMGDDSEKYIEERLAAVCEDEASKKIQLLSDGRVFAIAHRPLADGGWVATHEDISELAKAEAMNQRLARIVEDAINEIYVFDAESHKFIQVNASACENLGYTMEELCERTPLDLKPEFTHESFENHIAPLRSGEKTHIQFATVHRRKDGSLYDVMVTLQQIRSQNQQVFAAIIEDITERKDTERQLVEHRDHLQELVNEATLDLNAKAQELEAALAKEKELNKLQRQFVSMASHEFRTPLSIIDGSAQFLARKGENITTDYLLSRTEKIREAVARMTRLMESTLTAASIQEGKISIEIGPCDVARLVSEVCARQQELSKSHVFSCNVAHLPATIQADSGSLDQVLTNLLSNAVKYAPDAPKIDVVGCTEGDEVVIAVRDHGLGIDKDDLPGMFDRFFRAKTSTGIEGTGIGLNLVKTLVDMHGGSIGVESEKGKGSTFILRLPIAGLEPSELSDTKAA